MKTKTMSCLLILVGGVARPGGRTQSAVVSIASAIRLATGQAGEALVFPVMPTGAVSVSIEFKNPAAM